MKTKWYLTALLVLTALATRAQLTAYGNFLVQDQQIVWQAVFAQDSITASRLKEFYSSVPAVSDVQMSGDKLTFALNDVVVDYKKFQFSQVSTPSIIQTGKYSGKVSVAVRDGRYRITVTGFQLTGDITYKKITSRENLTAYATENNGTLLKRDWCKPNTLGLLDKALADVLQYRAPAEGDW